MESTVIVESMKEEELAVGELEKIIEKRILPKSSMRKLLGFGRSFEVPISNFPETELALILSNPDEFKKQISERIESSIPAAFPKIELRTEVDSAVKLVIGDPNPDMAAEWKWK